MGQCSAMSSMQRVLDKHRQELVADVKNEYPSKLIVEWGVDISEDCYGIDQWVKLKDGTILTVGKLDIDTLAERFQDCEVGY